MHINYTLSARCCKSFSQPVYHDIAHNFPFLLIFFVSISTVCIIPQNVKVLISHFLYIFGHSDGSLSMIVKK